MPFAMEFRGKSAAYPDELIDWVQREITARHDALEGLLLEAMILQDFDHLENLCSVDQNGEFSVASMLEPA